MKGLFIINPSSGTQTVQKTAIKIINKMLLDPESEGMTVFYTHGKDDARAKAASLKPGDYDFVLGVGGDGTINEVAVGLYQSGSEIPLAILPAGTTNDFAVSVGLPHDVDGVCKILKSRQTQKMDLGRFNDYYFYNVAAGGALSEVAHTTGTNMKTALGRAAYLIEGAKKFASVKFSTVPLIFEIDGVEEKHDVYFFILANSTSVGGFHKIAPLASVNDGLLDLCILKNVDFASTLPLLNQIKKGTHTENEDRFVYRQCRSLKVRSEDSSLVFPLDYDGEYGGNLPLEASVIEGAVNLIVG